MLMIEGWDCWNRGGVLAQMRAPLAA